MKVFAYLLIVGLGAACLGAAEIVAGHPQKDMIFRSLQRLVDQESKADVDHFFIVRRNDGRDWVYWREGRRLWVTDMTPYYEKKGRTEVRARAIWDLRLYAPFKPIDLDAWVTDKLAQDRFDPRVTTDFVARIVYDCVLNGEMVTAHRRRPNQTPEPTAMSVTPPAAQEPRQP